MIVTSKNNFPVFIDFEHLQNHLDPEQSGGTFTVDSKEDFAKKLTKWISQVTLPPETLPSFPGDPVPQPGSFVVKALIKCEEVIGWDCLVNIKSLADGTKVEWEIRRGHLTKTFPTIAPKKCSNVVIIIARIDQERLQKKIKWEVEIGRFSSVQEHPYWKFVETSTQWVLLTAYPGSFAPPQSDYSFWKNYGFATAKTT